MLGSSPLVTFEEKRALINHAVIINGTMTIIIIQSTVSFVAIPEIKNIKLIVQNIIIKEKMDPIAMQLCFSA